MPHVCFFPVPHNRKQSFFFLLISSGFTTISNKTTLILLHTYSDRFYLDYCVRQEGSTTYVSFCGKKPSLTMVWRLLLLQIWDSEWRGILLSEQIRKWVNVRERK
ncbi:hypothetical protein V6Z11_A08G209100 [Gossypium hirsutum]